jgi:hypothetical protein
LDQEEKWQEVGENCIMRRFLLVLFAKYKDEMGGACKTNGEKWNACGLLVGRSAGKRQVGRPRRRLVNNIKMDLREIGWGSLYWIDLAQDRDQWRALVNTVIQFWVP